MVVSGEDDVDARFLDDIQRQLLPANRAVDLLPYSQCKQRMMGDENAHDLTRRTRERVADELHLVPVDPSVLERE